MCLAIIKAKKKEKKKQYANSSLLWKKKKKENLCVLIIFKEVCLQLRFINECFGANNCPNNFTQLPNISNHNAII